MVGKMGPFSYKVQNIDGLHWIRLKNALINTQTVRLTRPLRFQSCQFLYELQLIFLRNIERIRRGCKYIFLLLLLLLFLSQFAKKSRFIFHYAYDLPTSCNKKKI